MKIHIVKKIIFSSIILWLFSLLGCSSTHVAPEVSDKFKINQISFVLSQRMTPAISYHTESEFQKILAHKVVMLLGDNGLLTTKFPANSLNIQVNYKRNFIDEQTSQPSDSLAYPNYDYHIQVLDADKTIITLAQKNLIFKGPFIMDIDVLAGRLDKKSDEIVFIDAIALKIVKSIQKMQKQLNSITLVPRQ